MNEVARHYSMSDGELVILAANIADNMNRDATEFAARGVDAAAITAYIALSDEFEAIAPDTYYAAQVTGKVEERDNARAAAIIAIQKISGFFEQEFGTDSWKYKQLSLKDITTIGTGNFLIRAKKVKELADDYLLELGAIGLTQTDIDALSAQIDIIETKVSEVNSAKVTREQKSVERVTKGNELFSKTSKYCRIGKLIWENVSESKYDDYQMYHRGTGLPSKVEDLNYDVANTKLKWSPSANAEEYQLQEKRDDPAFDWVAIYEGVDYEFIHTPAAGNWLYRCRGKNDEGYGSWSDELAVVQP